MGDWLTIIIVLLILGILLDGWRRMRNAQRDSLKVSRSMRKSARATSSERNEYSNSAELPNGGARVVAYRDSTDSEPRESTVRTRPRPSASKAQPVSEPSVSKQAEPEPQGWDDTDESPDYEGPEYEEQAFLEEPELDESGRNHPEPELNSSELSQDEIEEAQLDASHSAMPHRSRYAEQSSGSSPSNLTAPGLEEDSETEQNLTQEHEPVAEVPEYQEPERPVRTKARPASGSKGRIPQQVALNLDESVPILMETTENEEDQRASEQGGVGDSDRIEPTFGGAAGQNTTPSKPAKESSANPKPSFGSTWGATLTSKAMQAKDAFSAKLANSGFMHNSQPQEDAEPGPDNTPSGSRNAPEPEVRAAPQAPRKRAAAKSPPSQSSPPSPPQPEEVLIVNIMAPHGQQFRGNPLLDALIQAGLRFGDMNIFHRYEESRGGGPILFSLANMVKPGFFDLDAMDEFYTPGVSLFMTLPLDNARQGNVEVFELMLDSARSIADDLGGELKDENRSVMTRQTMEHCRQRIHEFERKQLSRAPS